MIIWISVYAILLNKIRKAMIIKVSVFGKKKKFLTVKLMSFVFFDSINRISIENNYLIHPKFSVEFP